MPAYIAIPFWLIMGSIGIAAAYSIYQKLLKGVNSVTLTNEQAKEYTNHLFWCLAAALLTIASVIAAAESIK